MGKNQSASGLTNVIQYNNGNITFVSGSTTLMSISSSGAITTTGVISGSNVLTASYANNAELLDGLDSTAFATTGAYSATSGSLYTVSSSAYATSGSLSATSGSLSAASGSLSAASGSFNTRVSALEATGSALSSSILSVSSSAYATSGSLSAASGSFNTRVASLETYSTNLTAKTASFATTGSNTFIGSQVVSGSLTASGSITATGTITAQTLVVQTITSSVVYSSGSNVFGNDIGNSQRFTGSVLITGSLTIAGASSATSYSGTTIYGSTVACSPIGCFATSCATSFIGGTMSGTTIYGSTVVCSPVGYFSGCVGIGTITPNTYLQIVGNISTTTGLQDAQFLTITNSNATANNYSAIMFKDSDGNNSAGFGVQQISHITNEADIVLSPRLANGDITERIRIKGNGNVGIGTASPCAKLHINGSTGASTYKGFAYTYAGSETLINEVLFQAVVGGYSSNLPIFLFKDERSDQGTTQRIFEIQGGRSGVGTILTTLASGNVGIGTSSPNFKTHISTGDTTSITQPTAGTYGLYVQQNTSGNVGGLYIQDGASNSGNSIYVGDNNGAARFVINTDGSVGIGICSPTHQLHVVNSVKFDTGLYFNNSAANGAFVWQIANESLRFGTCDTERMRIINSGNVGIGASSPAAKLHTCTAYGGSNTQAIFGNSNYSINSLVYDTVIIQADDVTTLKLVERNSGGVDQVLTMTVGDNSSRISTTCANQLQFFVGGSPSACGYNGLSGTAALTITGVGNVGIGTSSPASQVTGTTTGILDVSAATGGNLVLHRNGSGDTALFSILKASNGTYIDSTGAATAANNAIYFRNNELNGDQTSLTTRLTILSGGNVGIGTTSPSQKLEVVGNIYANDGASTAITVYNASSIRGKLSMTGNEGDLTLYGSSANATIYLSAYYDSYFNGGAVFIHHPSNLGEGKLRVSQNGSYWNTEIRHTYSTQYFMLFRYCSTGIGSIQGNGSNVSYYTTSDYRLKEDLKEVNGLEKIAAIKIYNYKWKNNDLRMDGVLAHELSNVLPYAVTGDKDALDKDGNINPQGVDYSKLAPVIVKAIQEQQCTICSQASMINTLKTCLGIS